MAFTHVKSQISPSVVKTGGAATPAGATDDLLTTGSPVKFSPRVDRVTFDSHGDSFTNRVGIAAARQWDVSYSFFMQGSGALGTTAINGFAAIDSTLRTAAMTLTAVAGTSLSYAPSTIATLEKQTVWGENHGALHKAANVVGNVVFRGEPTSGLQVSFTGIGDYAEPTLGNISGFAGGGVRHEAFLNVMGTITSSGTAYVPVITAMTFDRGIQTARIPDANSTTGIQESFVRDAIPTLNVSIAIDTQAAGAGVVTYPKLYADLTSVTTHQVEFTCGTAVGNKSKFTFPTAELTNITLREGDGFLIGDLAYNVTHATDETEFTIVIT